ncbi:MAG TPA: nucleotidyl transferase AbiEii/AbiGii toxin family protein [Longimicrobium sp.]|nr:nucleotidyl transferase AbiEii/AbiGii toxin family protein [Longimicrobium sp.]
MSHAPRPPRSHAMLSRWVDAYAKRSGQDPVRVRRWISFMALGGALEKAGYAGEGPRFSVKGGVALELRFPGRARATKDLDLVLNHPDDDPVEALDAALGGECEGFTFRRRGEAEELPAGAVRVDVSVRYGGKGWARIQVDLARRETPSPEVEMVDGLDLSFFRFDFPARVPCLSIHAQAAQKIHGLTLPSRADRRNDRFKDLVDLLLLRELITDFDRLRAACEHLVAARAAHGWPPRIEAHAHWNAPFARMAREIGLPIVDLDEAVGAAREFLGRIDPRAAA